ncbi:hypothetical protein [Halorhabdus rudnickae]|uniref:hypothetical protein n=1 Tax=Halorhabdus rudnickae TaxID=1775544 RepID=UPI0010831522|nr:hypothetical protein [Halorhabdus rudnickae]
MAASETTEGDSPIQEGEGSVDIVLPDGRYTYVGEDGEGWHHHYDSGENIVYVTSKPALGL